MVNLKLLNAITTFMKELEDHGIVGSVCQFCGVEIDVDPVFNTHDFGCPYYSLMYECSEAVQNLTDKLTNA